MESNAVELINEIDEDKSIYRICPPENLAEWFETKKLKLLSPNKWSDPFEKVMVDAVTSKMTTHNNERIFGLCFSENGTSDALWRIYSPDQFGVRFRIKIRNILNALTRSLNATPGRTFLGKVVYTDGRRLAELAKNSREKPLETKDAASNLMVKRTPFRYEQEVRILHFCRSDAIDIFDLDIDPREVIETILIDPRANERKVRMLKKYFKEIAGFNRRVEISRIYKEPKIK